MPAEPRMSLEEQRVMWQKEYDKKYGPGKVVLTTADVEEINRNLVAYFELLIETEKKLIREGKLPAVAGESEI